MIDFLRAHRALRPKGPDTAPPRDIICCLQSFTLKEEIMHNARRNEQVVFNGANIMFQDLSQITLKNRRALRRLLEALREKELRYTWRFPFALTVNLNGHQHVLCEPDDLPEFCSALGLDQISLPDWYAEFQDPPGTGRPRDLPSPLPKRGHPKSRSRIAPGAQRPGHRDLQERTVENKKRTSHGPQGHSC